MAEPRVPPLCRETQSQGQQMLNAPLGINGLTQASPTVDDKIFQSEFKPQNGTKEKILSLSKKPRHVLTIIFNPSEFTHSQARHSDEDGFAILFRVWFNSPRLR